MSSMLPSRESLEKAVAVLNRNKGKITLGILLTLLGATVASDYRQSKKPETIRTPSYYGDLLFPPPNYKPTVPPSGSGRKSTKKTTKKTKRGALVSKLMKMEGLTLGEASKYIKMHNLM